MATIAVGDIHGNLLALMDLLGQLRSEIAGDDTVVFLGDYIDRGPDAKGCVDAILEFQREVTTDVVCLRGNHEDWFLRTLGDYERHSWLLGMEAFNTIHSYSIEAALALREAVSAAGLPLFLSRQSLPYNLFFEKVPEAHLSFFESLSPYYRSSDGICVHGGLNPHVPRLEDQTVEALIWGASGFPDEYRGVETVAYGHWDNAELDPRGWPKPRIIGSTIGLDTISHGVLTAIRLADRRLFQSAQHRVSGRRLTATGADGAFEDIARRGSVAGVRRHGATTMTQPTTAELIENAADSLRHGVAHYLVRDEAPTAIKHAILNIYNSIELFLKARISQAHPLLIYRSLDKRVSSDSQTVGLAEMIIRLENLDMPLEVAQKHALVTLQNKRNRIEHFTFQASADHENAVGQALKFLLGFVPTLGTSLESLLEETADYSKLLVAILSYEEHLTLAVAAAGTAGGNVARCLECGERTVSVRDGSGYCHLCHEFATFQQCERCGEVVPQSELEDYDLCEACLRNAFGS